MSNPAMVAPATTIFPSRWSAEAYATLGPSKSADARASPSHESSGVPSALKRVTTAWKSDPLWLLAPATTTLPSGCTSTATASSFRSDANVTLPASPKLGFELAVGPKAREHDLARGALRVHRAGDDDLAVRRQ